MPKKLPILSSVFKLRALSDALGYRVEDIFGALCGPRPERKFLIAGAKKTGLLRDFSELVAIACVLAARPALKPAHRSDLLAAAQNKYFKDQIGLAVNDRLPEWRLNILPDSPPQFDRGRRDRGRWDSVFIDVAVIARHLHERLECLAVDPEWVSRNAVLWAGPAEVSED